MICLRYLIQSKLYYDLFSRFLGFCGHLNFLIPLWHFTDGCSKATNGHMFPRINHFRPVHGFSLKPSRFLY